MYNYCTLDQDDLVDFGEPTFARHSPRSYRNNIIASTHYTKQHQQRHIQHAAVFQLYDAKRSRCLTADDVGVMLLEVRCSSPFACNAHLVLGHGQAYGTTARMDSLVQDLARKLKNKTRKQFTIKAFRK